MSLQTGLFKTKIDNPVLGLDLSLTGTGIVLIGGDGKPSHGRTVGYALQKGATQQQRIERLIDVAKSISAIIEELFPHIGTGPSFRDLVIAIEGFAFGARFGGEFLGELQGVVKVQLYSQYGKVPVVYPPTKVRKTVFGYGGSDKKRIKVIVDKLEEQGVFGDFKFEDHNQRDAWAVAEYARLELAK